MLIYYVIILLIKWNYILRFLPLLLGWFSCPLCGAKGGTGEGDPCGTGGGTGEESPSGAGGGIKGSPSGAGGGIKGSPSGAGIRDVSFFFLFK